VPESAKPSFFISRAGEDAEWGLWIAEVLGEEGYPYFLQDHHMGLGDNIFERTREELEKSRHIIAVLSPDYLAKEHTRREMNAGCSRDAGGIRRTLLIVRVRECEIPIDLEALVYLDLRERDEQAKRMLLDRIAGDAYGAERPSRLDEIRRRKELLLKALEDFANHARALRLLGTDISDLWEGDLDRRVNSPTGVIEHAKPMANLGRVMETERKAPHTPTVFVSYSQKDKSVLNQLFRQLKVLVHEDLIDPWSDSRIRPGEDWSRHIEEAIGRARVAILLVSVNFLNSEFILHEEVPKLLAKQAQPNFWLIPILIGHCPWERMPWLENLHVITEPGKKPITGEAARDRHFAAVAGQVAAYVRALL
jgi:TIR domain